MMQYSRLMRNEKHAGGASLSIKCMGCGIWRLKLSLQMYPTKLLNQKPPPPHIHALCPNADYPCPEQGVSVAKHPWKTRA